MRTIHSELDPYLNNGLSCPLCRQGLLSENGVYRCTSCDHSFPRTTQGQGDFRISHGSSVSYLQRYIPLQYDIALEVPAQREVPCKERRNEFRGVVPLHLTRNQISYIPQARQQGEIALDLGCGDGIHSSVLRELGYVYYGVDFANTAADDLVDAHSLPYHDNLFDLVFSIAVLEHLTQPLKALDEIHRVLKPSKYFIGTVAFLEPFHDNSFFHFSHLGLWAALQSTGFSVEVILCIKGWHVFRAQLEMGFGSHMPRLITSLFAQPFAWALKSYAFLGRRLARNKFRHKRDLSLARHAGGFFFVAQKLPRLTDPIKKSSDINANTGRK